MKSPFTGKDMKLHIEPRVMEYRKEPFSILAHFYVCSDTGEQFTDDHLDELNITQVHNQYRERTGIPFPEEIIAMREQYGLSAAKMSEILGFGANSYRNYEAGEVPSVANGRMLQMIREPEEFLKLLEYSVNNFTQEEYIKIKKKIGQSLADADLENVVWETRLLGSLRPSINNGYRTPNLEKICNMIGYFAQQSQPFTTKLNKLMFYTDFASFRENCHSVSGLTYRAIQMGPVPNHYGYLYSIAYENGYAGIQEIIFNDGVGEKYVAGDKTFDAMLFTKAELKIMERVAELFGSKSVTQTIDLSHKEAAWQENIDHYGSISYAYGFQLKEI